MHLIHVSWLAMTLKLTAVKEKSSAVFLSRDIFDPYMTFLIWPSIVAVAVPAALDDCFGHRQEYCFSYDFFSQSLSLRKMDIFGANLQRQKRH